MSSAFILSPLPCDSKYYSEGQIEGSNNCCGIQKRLDHIHRSEKEFQFEFRSYSSAKTHRSRGFPFQLNMCQLLGMNCKTPTDFVFSFRGFQQRGGVTDKHSDGWGCIFYEGRGVRAFHDSAAASESPIADLMSNYPIKTLNMIAHIRYATAGGVALENVHPFQREMWGIVWCFAHNGDVPKFGKDRAHPWIGKIKGERTYNPVGDTDSEAVFCALLNYLKARFKVLPTM